MYKYSTIVTVCLLNLNRIASISSVNHTSQTNVIPFRCMDYVYSLFSHVAPFYIYIYKIINVYSKDSD